LARVAIVTGGTRGIGEAISKALKAAGYQVAAIYGGNDEAAQKFKTETGIPVYKWDVSSFDSCSAGIKQVEADLGPIEVLINNAGITRDSMFHRMTPENWTSVINTNLNSLFNMCRPVIEGMRSRKFGRIINISRGRWARATILLPRRASSALPRRWRRKTRVTASPLTQFAQAISPPRW